MEIYQNEYIKKIQTEYERINYTAWLHGIYVRDAVNNVLRGYKAKYPRKPYSNQQVDDNVENIDVYESFRRKIRAMNERIKENQSNNESNVE